MIMSFGRRAAWLIAAVLISNASSLRAGELDEQMERFARTFSYAAYKAGAFNKTLIVYPFSGGDELSGKKYDRACSEILTKHLIRLKSFRVLEKSRLDAVLKERRLETGASMAAGGKTTMEKKDLFIVGGLSRLKDHYRISAQLIDAGTGVLISSTTADMPLRTFERESELYLAWPDTSIGIGFMGIYSPLSVTDVPSTDLLARVNPYNPSGAQFGAGISANFYFQRKWLLNFVILPFMRITPDATEFSAWHEDPPPTEWRGMGLQFTMNHGIKLNRRLRAIAGIGGAAYRMNNQGKSGVSVDVAGSLYPLHYPYHIAIIKKEFTSIQPLVRLGVEWKLIDKIGLSLFGNYTIIRPATITERASASANGTDDILADTVIRKFALPQFYSSAAFTYYF